MAEHAELGASSSERWLECPGSVRESRGKSDRSTIYAVEGTAAHDVAAQCLRDGRDAIEFLDRVIQVIEGPEDHQIVHQIPCNEEMVEGVQLYLDLCRELNDWGFNENNLVFVETRVSVNELAPDYSKPLFGTCDYGLYKPAERRLIVTDFKYGQGVLVDVKDNTQARYYALGLLLMLKDEPVDVIELIICQPRAAHRGEGPIRRHEITVDELLDWADKVLVPGIMATEAPDAPLVPGDHCQFCRAAADCRSLREHAFDKAMVLFDDLDAMPVTSVEPTPPQKLTPQQISQLLNCSDTIMMWLRSVREHAFSLMNAGVEIPGWKIVGRKGRRKWTQPPEAIAAELAMRWGLPPDELWNQKLKSPNQVETLIKKAKGRDAKYIQTQIGNSGLYEIPMAGTTLARRDDEREEVLGVELATFERLDPP